MIVIDSARFLKQGRSQLGKTGHHSQLVKLKDKEISNTHFKVLLNSLHFLNICHKSIVKNAPDNLSNE